MKQTKRQIKFLERKEVEKLINAIPRDGYRNLRDRALLEVLFSTGMRIHEALELPEAPFVSEKNRTMEMSIVGKGDWQRVIFFSPKALEAIKNYLIVKNDEELELFPITSRCAQLMIKRRAKLAGIEKRVSPHILRHSLATDLLMRGVDVRVVQEFLGHRSISSTQVYTHVTNAQLKDIHKKLYK